jgi:hypothetical protein
VGPFDHPAIPGGAIIPHTAPPATGNALAPLSRNSSFHPDLHGVPHSPRGSARRHVPRQANDADPRA